MKENALYAILQGDYPTFAHTFAAGLLNDSPVGLARAWLWKSSYDERLRLGKTVENAHNKRSAADKQVIALWHQRRLRRSYVTPTRRFYNAGRCHRIGGREEKKKARKKKSKED